MKILFYIKCLLFIFCTIVKFSITATTNATSGPYKAMLIRTQECENTTYPLDKDPPMTMKIQVYNSSKSNFFLRGNLTVFRDNRQVKIKLKSFIWRNGKWKLTYLMHNTGCHGLLMYMFITAMGLKYDRETCGFMKGKYTFNDIDTDVIQHLRLSEMEYGRILWISEMTTLSTTYTCWEYETLVEPLNK